MFQLIRKLTPSTVKSISNFCDDNLNLTVNSRKSSYAVGRSECWLGTEAALSQSQMQDLNDNVFVRRPNPTQLGNWLVKVWQECSMPEKPELGLANFGPVGITWHADASYADPDCLLINLGGVKWGFNPSRNHAKNPDSEAEFHTLDAGEIIRFDCKHQHEAIEPVANRWSIILWRISPKFRPTFQSYQSSQPQTWPGKRY